MKPEHQVRLVQVLVEPGPDGNKYGVCTGFAITQNRILTCAHALRGAKQLQIRFIEKQSEWLEATQLWPPKTRRRVDIDPAAPTDPAANDELDAAVLEIDPTAVARILVGPIEPLLGYSSPADRDEWCSRGMPLAAALPNHAGKPIWEAVDFGGHLYRANACGVMSLDVETSPTNAEDWHGGSGSPVFAADRLVAVINSWSPAWGGKKLKALWVGHLWKQPDFCKAAGLEREGECYAELRQRIARILNDLTNELLRAELGRIFKLEQLEGNLLVEHLCGLTSLELLYPSNHVLGRLLDRRVTEDERKALTLAEELERIVEELLPWGTQPDVLAKLKAFTLGTGALYLALPCASMSVAEVYLARLDERYSRFKPTLADGGIAVGELCAPFDPRVGFGANPSERTRQLLVDLGLAHGIDIRSMTQTELESAAKQVNDVIEDKAIPRYDVPPARPYLLFHRADDEKPVERLSRLLPALRVCRIQRDQFANNEAKLCAQLKDFATLKSRRERQQQNRKAPA